MPPKPELSIQLFRINGFTPLASVVSPRKITIKSAFGAGKRRCWIELFNEDASFPAALGCVLEVWINGVRCFRGRVAERRIDSIDDRLSLYAVWDPEREFNQAANGRFENLTTDAILDLLMANSPLKRAGAYGHAYAFGAIEFSDYPFFSAVDLLAKLAGNWLWDVGEDAALRFRPRQSIPDHPLFLAPGAYVVNLWETVNDAFAYVRLNGGFADGEVYENWIALPGRLYSSEAEIARVYVRPLASFDAVAALRRAILQQMRRPNYEHYVDLIGYGEKIAPGDTVRFRADDMPQLPQDRIFRVKMREITYAHEQLQTRLHLTSGLESSSTFFYYFHNDSIFLPSFKEGKSGAFQLDVSAMDSQTHIDAA
ncbi:MAG: hypothetical protein AB1656_23355 [Candidatus Omnitrophota bacterium]